MESKVNNLISYATKESLIPLHIVTYKHMETGKFTDAVFVPKYAFYSDVVNFCNDNLIFKHILENEIKENIIFCIDSDGTKKEFVFNDEWNRYVFGRISFCDSYMIHDTNSIELINGKKYCDLKKTNGVVDRGMFGDNKDIYTALFTGKNNESLKIINYQGSTSYIEGFLPLNIKKEKEYLVNMISDGQLLMKLKESEFNTIFQPEEI